MAAHGTHDESTLGPRPEGTVFDARLGSPEEATVTPGVVTVVAWNLLHGGGRRRMAEIALWLLESRADVVVLSEYRRAMGGQLRGILADHGLSHQACSEPGTGKNGLLIASRLATRVVENPEGSEEIRHFWIEVELAACGLSIAGAHIPDASRERQRLLTWSHAAARARARREERFLVIGDLNSGRPRLDEPGDTLRNAAFLGKFAALGYVDPWRERNGTRREATWESHEGTGFRIDHALVSGPLSPRIREVFYRHGVRETGLSDHSAMVVVVETR